MGRRWSNAKQNGGVGRHTYEIQRRPAAVEWVIEVTRDVIEAVKKHVERIMREVIAQDRRAAEGTEKPIKCEGQRIYVWLTTEAADRVRQEVGQLCVPRSVYEGGWGQPWIVDPNTPICT